MRNDEKVIMNDDSTLTSPNHDDIAEALEDQEFQPLTKHPESLPWYVRHIKSLDSYLQVNEKKLPSLKFAMYLCGLLLFLVLLKRLVFDWETGGRNIVYNSATKNTNGIKTYTSPFLDIVFENPLSYSDIRTPAIESEDYIPRLQMVCYLYNKDHLNIIIRDADKVRYELPHEHPFPFPKDVNSVLPEDSDFIMNFQLEPFNLVVKRKSTEEIIFNLADRFVFTNLYLEVSFMMPTNEIYGLGERIAPLQFKDGTYSIFILDRIGQIDHGKPGYNAQGHHSMYLCKEFSDLYHVTLLKNINAQEVTLKKQKLTWQITGGVVDFHFFLGESPEDVLQKYHSYIGGWTLPAFWHMGYHQSKWWGYKDTNELENVLENFEKHEIPMDVLWSDLDIYEDDQNFNWNTNRFPPAETTEMFKKYNKKWITVVQAYIPAQKTNPCWQYEGDNLLDLVIKDGVTKDALAGYEFSGFVYFIDFLNPKSEKFWSHMLDYMNDKVPISGFWLDANELTNMMTKFEVPQPSYYHNIEKRKYWKLPFYPGGENLYDLPLVKLDALHYGDVEEYNVRSLSAYHQSMYTYDYLKKKKEGTYFPFVLSRGNMFGMGQFSFHFVPDIESNWKLLRGSLGPTLTYPIFGIPMIGADICGFVGERQTGAELCARWHQLSVFYTFARNHHAPQNSYNNHQEPYTYKDTTFTSIKNSILLRYSLLKQLYTYFFTRPGKQLRVGTVMRPLFFEFHRKSRHDEELPEYGEKVYEEQFMMSDAIMVAPVLYEKRKDLKIYFPLEKWFDLRDGKEVPMRGDTLTLPAPVEGVVPHFLRGGKMVFKQDVTGVKSTEDLNNVFNITVGLPDFVTRGKAKGAEAVGNILDVPNYSEEVIYKQCTEKNCLMNVTVACVFGDGTFTTTVTSKSHSSERTENPVEIKEIHLLGAPKELFSEKLTGKVENEKGTCEYEFNQSTGVLKILISNNLILSNNSEFTLSINV